MKQNLCNATTRHCLRCFKFYNQLILLFSYLYMKPFRSTENLSTYHFILSVITQIIILQCITDLNNETKTGSLGYLLNVISPSPIHRIHTDKSYFFYPNILDIPMSFPPQLTSNRKDEFMIM